MSGKGKFKSKKVLENAKEIVGECTATAFDIVSDYELEHSNLEGHVFAVYSVEDSRYAHAITPYFDDLRTYNVIAFFDVSTDDNYFIVDITNYTGLDYDVDEYFKEDEINELIEENIDDLIAERGSMIKDYQGKIDQVNMLKDEIAELKANNSMLEALLEDKQESDYSVAGFKNLTMPRKENTQIEIVSQLVEEDEAPDPIQKFYAKGYVGNYEDSFEDDEEDDDIVNQPSHYNYGEVEVIDYIEQQAKVMYESGSVPPEAIPHICNAIKYISRFQSKGKPVEDLKKSIFYINRAIEKYDEE